jgi:hypothetical protein
MGKEILKEIDKSFLGKSRDTQYENDIKILLESRKILKDSKSTKKFFENAGSRWYEFKHKLTDRMYYVSTSSDKRRWGRPKLDTSIMDDSKPVLYKYKIKPTKIQSEYYIGLQYTEKIYDWSKPSGTGQKKYECKWITLPEIISNEGYPQFLHVSTNKYYPTYKEYSTLNRDYTQYCDKEDEKKLKDQGIFVEGEIVPLDATWYFEKTIGIGENIMNANDINIVKEASIKNRKSRAKKSKTKKSRKSRKSGKSRKSR